MIGSKKARFYYGINFTRNVKFEFSSSFKAQLKLLNVIGNLTRIFEILLLQDLYCDYVMIVVSPSLFVTSSSLFKKACDSL